MMDRAERRQELAEMLDNADAERVKALIAGSDGDQASHVERVNTALMLVIRAVGKLAERCG